MKNLLVVTFFVLLIILGCATIKQKPVATNIIEPTVMQKVDFSEQSTWLLGYFDLRRLTEYPYSSWYLKGLDDYQPSTEALNKLFDIDKSDLEIKIVLGTWCPDSRREVPRFMKIIDLWKFPLEKITFIGVDNSKLSPIGDYDNLAIQRVPTFIFYKKNIEAGRIIENPVTSLEQDMVNILNRNEK